MSRIGHAWLPAVVAGGLALLLVGAGPVNGDAAVYLDQIVDGDITARWTHAGFIMIFMMFRGVGDLSLLLDVASVLASVVAIGAWGTALAERGGEMRAGWLLAGLVLPFAPFGEVDTLWLALCGLGFLAGPRAGAALLGLAVTVSPTALATIPWIVIRKQDSRWIGALVAVLVLTVVSQGGWWTGTRGVLTGGWAPDPLRNLPWLVVPLGMAVWAHATGRARLRWADALALVGLLAPGDVPGFWIAALPLVSVGSAVDDRRGWAAMVALVGMGMNTAAATHERVERETATIRSIAAEIGPGDAIVGPWSWGVRINLAHSGEAAGIPFAKDAVPCEGRRVYVPLGTWERCE
ncbi:MAG: hypothetical protein H6737_26650 [Alphaproteobacteria bacterium]|nr:hypothetical protein [Alphaproteobacteria bacterium]